MKKKKAAPTGKKIVLMRASEEFRTELTQRFNRHGWNLQRGLENVLGAWMHLDRMTVVQKGGTETSSDRVLAQIAASLQAAHSLGVGLPRRGKKR